MKTSLAITTTGLLFSTAVAAFDYGDPTPNEQAHLEAINHARMAPLDEANRLAIDLFEGITEGSISAEPVQPLSFNASLTETAREHSRDILFRNFFGHENPDGETPFDRIMAGGYLYRSAGENIAIYGTTGFLDQEITALKLHDNLFIDQDYPDREHRVNILVPDFREIGVGLADGNWQQGEKTYNAQVVTTNFGLREDSLPILLGVVYDDENKDSIYQAGEGTPDISIEVLQTEDDSLSATAGGYGLELMPGHYIVTFSDENLGSVAKPVKIGSQNVKIDTLLAEFKNPKAVSQCALLSEQHLLAPCLMENGQHYVADFGLIESNDSKYELLSVKSYPLTGTKQCAIIDRRTQIAHFPCVTFNEQQYWADFQLTDSSPNTPAEIELLDFGLL